MSAFASPADQSLEPPQDAVNCLRCQGEGIVMTCRDRECIENNECIHALYEDCDACGTRGWIV